MLIKQISVFVENRPGRLFEITGVLRDAGVDMSGPEPVETALKLFNSLMDEMEELLLK